MEISKLHLILIIFVVSGSAYGADSGCEAKSTHEHIQCAAQLGLELDKELNRVYQLALKQMEDPELLRKSQRAWLKFRDEQCALIGSREGGNSAWVTYNNEYCRNEMLKERIRFLKDIANEL